MVVLLSPFSLELLSPFSPELGYLLFPHLLLVSPFSPEVEPEPVTPRLRRRWLAGSDAEPSEPRRRQRSEPRWGGGGVAGAGEKKLP
jgi:hypothetical protein